MKETKNMARETESDNRGKKGILRIGSVVVNIVLLLAILLVVFSAISRRNNNGIILGPFGSAVVLTGSMEPSIKTGSLILIKKVPDESLRIGDVITFRPLNNSSVLLTHRIIDVDREMPSFITQGDANKTPDNGYVYPDSIVGKVIVAIPKLGSFMNYLKTPQGMIIFVVIIVLLQALWYMIPKKTKNNNENENDKGVNSQ